MARCAVAIFFVFRGQTMQNRHHTTVYKTRRRASIIFIAFSLFLSLLIYNLASLTLSAADEYRERVLEQITCESSISAKRGIIYDRNMTVLATDKTTYRVFTSTKQLQAYKKQSGTDAARAVCDAVCPILNLNSDTLYARLTAKASLDINIKKNIDEEEYQALSRALSAQRLEKCVSVEATNTRYYPEGTRLAHTLGFVGADAQGLYGLEYYYDKTLSGTRGYYLYGKDAGGNPLPDGYTDIVEPKSGSSLVLTVVNELQAKLEGTLEKIRIEQSTTSRAAGICMDIKTGAILAIATSSPFNPNEPMRLDATSQQKLDTSGYAEGSDEYRAYKSELLSIMWSNKAISETYEPGSTFKIITVSSALDAGVAKVSDTFSCHGYLTVGGWHIRCHKARGHGSGFSLAYGLQMSCNPCMMTVAARLGADKFYDYVNAFGYLEKTGVDLPSEASSIFHKPGAIGETELATASFGQRFKVSLIRQLTSICAVANGGVLMKPYIVDSIISDTGEVISKTKPQQVRRVISEGVAKEVSAVLVAGTSGDGGAKNAAVAGYGIAGKTGTSQKFDILDANGASFLRIGSCVAYSVSDSGDGIATIIMTDEPQGQIKYGSVTAAPYVSEFMSYALPYLGYEPSTPVQTAKIPDIRDMTLADAEKTLKSMGITYEIAGSGDRVISQTPAPDEIITLKDARVIINTDEKGAYATVPDLMSMTADEARRLLLEKSLSVRLVGADVSEGANVISQSVTAGAVVPLGTVIEIGILHLDFED